MGAKTKGVSYRVTPEVKNELARLAKLEGISPNAYACEAMLEKLQRTESQNRGWLELFEEVRRLRSDLARSTEAVLSVAGKGDNAREKAATWVRNNLNR